MRYKSNRCNQMFKWPWYHDITTGITERFLKRVFLLMVFSSWIISDKFNSLEVISQESSIRVDKIHLARNPLQKKRFLWAWTLKERVKTKLKYNPFNTSSLLRPDIFVFLREINENVEFFYVKLKTNLLKLYFAILNWKSVLEIRCLESCGLFI
jgi:hypothetical protein